MVRMIDLPEGWKFSFPREFTFKSQWTVGSVAYREELAQWLRSNGYPRRLIDLGMPEYIRIWDEAPRAAETAEKETPMNSSWNSAFGLYSGAEPDPEAEEDFDPELASFICAEQNFRLQCLKEANTFNDPKLSTEEILRRAAQFAAFVLDGAVESTPDSED